MKMKKNLSRQLFCEEKTKNSKYHLLEKFPCHSVWRRMLEVLLRAGFLYSIEILKGNTSLMQFQCTLKFPFSIRIEQQRIERKFYFSSVALLCSNAYGFPRLFIQELRIVHMFLK